MVHPLFVLVICFFPDRTSKWCCELRRVLQLFFSSFSQASPPSSPILQFYSRCSLAILMLRFFSSHVSYSTCYLYEPCFPSDTYHPLFCCLASLASCSASLGLCCYLDLLSGYVGLLRIFYLAISIVGDNHGLPLMLIIKMDKQRHQWVSCILVLPRLTCVH